MATTARQIPGSSGYAHIVKRPGYCGGKAAIEKARIRVNNIASLLKQGKAPEQMIEAYPHLTMAQVHGALVYYYDHTEEIDAEIERDQGRYERHLRAKAEYLAKHTGR